MFVGWKQYPTDLGPALLEFYFINVLNKQGNR